MIELHVFIVSLFAYLWAFVSGSLVLYQFTQVDGPWTRKRVLVIAGAPVVVLFGLGHLILWVSYVTEKPKWVS